jgi:hypothetical protein
MVRFCCVRDGEPIDEMFTTVPSSLRRNHGILNGWLFRATVLRQIYYQLLYTTSQH